MGMSDTGYQSSSRLKLFLIVLFVLVGKLVFLFGFLRLGPTLTQLLRNEEARVPLPSWTKEERGPPKWVHRFFSGAKLFWIYFREIIWPLIEGTSKMLWCDMIFLRILKSFPFFFHSSDHMLAKPSWWSLTHCVGISFIPRMWVIYPVMLSIVIYPVKMLSIVIYPNIFNCCNFKTIPENSQG